VGVPALTQPWMVCSVADGCRYITIASYRKA